MLAAHPDQAIELAKQHQAELRQDLARIKGPARTHAPALMAQWWSELMLRFRPRPQDTMVPRLSKYPYR